MASLERTETTPEEILKLFKAKLMAGVHGCDEGLCHISADPNKAPSGLRAGRPFGYTITPSPTLQFDDAEFVGAGVNGATVKWHIVVTVHAYSTTDRAGVSEEFLTNPETGLFTAGLRPVLKALAGQELLNADGVAILNQPLIPADADWARDGVMASGNVQAAFEVNFDYDLTS